VKFFLGTHECSWLERCTVPLFVSHRRLARRVSLPRARCEWALDSGGFTELAKFGRWRTEVEVYVDAARRYRDGIGRMAWAAPMDWMCEPFMIERTGLDIDRHQALTVENVSVLREHAPDVAWIPVLQGWSVGDYLICAARYYDAGIDLRAEPVVGVGSVCRRQGTTEIADIFRELRLAGIACHGFGVKTRGLARYGVDLVSADSMAWSYDARRAEPLPGCTHRNCANCSLYALRWRRRLLGRLEAAA
jgi:hypothetical protein